MTKNSSSEGGGWRVEDGQTSFPSSIFCLPFSFFVTWMALAPFLVSCRTANPPPVADFSAPGWHVLQGQAVWKPADGQAEFAGDLLFATNANGNFFVQLTKNPFPLVTAESMGGQWQIGFGADERAWRGRGEPPTRFVWFQLPRALQGGKIAGNWRFKSVMTNFWRLENQQTGETLEGGFFP